MRKLIKDEVVVHISDLNIRYKVLKSINTTEYEVENIKTGEKFILMINNLLLINELRDITINKILN